ncbi:MAG: hypothetical protein AAGF79_19180 [Pseudomonadota bacterium]
MKPKRSKSAVLGVIAPPARPTRAGATWLGLVIALPVGALLCLVELIWRWLG